MRSAAARRASSCAKAGSRKGAPGFVFKHAEFLLLPTLFHEQAAKLRLPPETPLPTPRADGQLEVRFAALRRVDAGDQPTGPTVQRLAPFHLWQETEIEKRFSAG